MTKLIAKLLLLVIILSACFTLSGCSIKIEPTWRSLNTSFMVTIDGVKQQKVVDFEISKTYYLKIKLFGNVSVNDNTHKYIKMEYNEENTTVTYSYDTPRSKTLTYKITLHELGSNDTLKITYSGKTIEVGYNVLDYDFESAGWITPTSIEDLNSFPEFKEMLLSIKYHEFQEPYIGIESYSYSTYWNEGDWYYHFDDKYDTEYLKYLTDSVYYPSAFNLVLQNPIASREAHMSFVGRDTVRPGAPRSVIEYFSVTYSVIDPCCTKPKYPLRSLSFSAESKDKYKAEAHEISRNFLFNRYPERFFEYDLNGLKIYIRIIGNTNVYAIFADERYFYTLYAGYVYD